MLPNFIIAGNPRSGSTSLFYYLKQHPEISFSAIKEPRYFSSIGLDLPLKGPGDNTQFQNVVFTFDEYKKLYEKVNNKRVGDASIQYLYSYQSTADLIKADLGDIPILILLRNPIERAYSAYNLKIRDGFEKESFESAINLEEERLNSNYDMLWAYASNGLYFEAVKKYKEVFSKVRIVLFEEFIEDPKSSLEEIFDFLEVTKNVNIDTSKKYAHAGKPKNKLVELLTSNKYRFTQAMRNVVLSLVPRWMIESIASGMFNKSSVSPQMRRQLEEYFKEDINKLKSLIKNDLSSWH